MSDSRTAWTIAHQAPLSVEFSRQEYWSGLPFPSPGDLPNSGIEPGSPARQENHLYCLNHQVSHLRNTDINYLGISTLLIDIDILIVQYICYQEEFAFISNTPSLGNIQVGARTICMCPLTYHYTFDTFDEEYQKS